MITVIWAGRFLNIMWNNLQIEVSLIIFVTN